MKAGFVLVGAALFAFAHVQMASDAKKSRGNGFGEDLDWVEWPNAVSTALDLDKPIFLLIHKTWCGACQALKKSFESSSKRKELVELSSKFVMTNTEDDDEPEEEEYAPDGRYIPRLFFLDKYGKPLAVDNKKNYANNAHYFPQVVDVIRAMKLALELYEKEKESSPDEPVEVPDNENKERKTDDEAKEKKQKDVKADKKEEPKKSAQKSKSDDKKKTEKNEPEKKSKQTDEKKKTKKEAEDEEVRVVEKPDEDSLGEIHLSEEELSFMETGGCPHAAAARAAAMQSAQSEKDEAESEKKDNKKDKKESKKENTKNEKTASTKKTNKDKETPKKNEKETTKSTKTNEKSKKTEL